jgi:uncharacterized coiled-coil protein SlyX
MHTRTVDSLTHEKLSRVSNLKELICSPDIKLNNHYSYAMFDASSQMDGKVEQAFQKAGIQFSETSTNYGYKTLHYIRRKETVRFHWLSNAGIAQDNKLPFPPPSEVGQGGFAQGAEGGGREVGQGGFARGAEGGPREGEPPGPRAGAAGQGPPAADIPFGSMTIDQIQRRLQRLTELSRHNAALHQAQRQQNERTAGLTERNTDLETRVGQLEATVAARDTTIAARDATIAERDATIQDQGAEIAQLKERLDKNAQDSEKLSKVQTKERRETTRAIQFFRNETQTLRRTNQFLLRTRREAEEELRERKQQRTSEGEGGAGTKRKRQEGTGDTDSDSPSSDQYEPAGRKVIGRQGNTTILGSDHEGSP